MSKEQTEKFPYRSLFGHDWVNPTWYLAEKILDRYAKSCGDVVPQRFFYDPYWQKKFKTQMMHASKLLKQFEIKYILEGLEHPDSKRVYSWGLKSFWEPLLRRIQKRHKQAKKARDDNESSLLTPQAINTEERPRPAFSTKTNNNLNKLRELEDEQDGT